MENNDEILHVREVFDRLDDRINIEEAEIDGKKKVLLHHGYKHLFEIEKFVNTIEKGWLGGFVDETSFYGGRRRLRVLHLANEYYRRLNTWLGRYSDIPRYSERVTAFYDVCRDLGFIGRRFEFGKPDEYDSFEGVRYADSFNELIKRVSERIKSRDFKERERWRRKNAERNEQNVLAMNDEMYEARSRWTILVLTLNYKQQYWRSITLEELQEHRARFFAARRFNKLLGGMENYIWTIEQGEKTGFHLHLVLYCSARHQRDVWLAQQIGEYWANVVTGGKGAYWNSNARKSFHASRGHGVGTGQIDRKDTAKRESLRKNLLYLAKASQYLMIKGAERVRTFDMGRVPERLKDGRPRIDRSEHAEIDVEIEQRIGDVNANSSDDIPWDYSVV
ncbi:inovirus-type Gp2 protein [Trinickia dinghuensis]|uniref:Inovirus Gp2 family protein n=1 Tax=Trinickia dinghuensis TaxID=2291023 RepID=A0A3D8JZN2_9BURK|nr:inovirus-type Gp2 protein [Trinickia dinghuensis]RDU98292.1 inovirus Gp2 family protein [Trinickia dinghuensis]